jgi:WhiB family redox-sensing transcriptional regulator
MRAPRARVVVVRACGARARHPVVVAVHDLDDDAELLRERVRRRRMFRVAPAADDVAPWWAPPPWHKDALCAEYAHAADDWFPRRGDRAALDRARAICRRCLVRGACLTFALERGIEQGVWGGLSGQDRRRLRAAIRAGRNIDPIAVTAGATELDGIAAARVARRERVLDAAFPDPLRAFDGG